MATATAIRALAQGRQNMKTKTIVAFALVAGITAGTAVFFGLRSFDDDPNDSRVIIAVDLAIA